MDMDSEVVWTPERGQQLTVGNKLTSGDEYSLQLPFVLVQQTVPVAHFCLSSKHYYSAA
jgi:hypothetical protein